MNLDPALGFTYRAIEILAIDIGRAKPHYQCRANGQLYRMLIGKRTYMHQAFYKHVKLSQRAEDQQYPTPEPANNYNRY